MIWKSEHIVQETDFYSYMQQQKRHVQPYSCDSTVAIIGGGPKGLYALNHLINQIHLHPTSTSVQVLWFNQDELFGCGPNYDVRQPDYLLINYCIGHIQAFHPDYRDLEDQQNFMEWLTTVKMVNTPIAPTDFASRALVGRYLQWVAAKTVSTLPSNVHLELIPQPVTDLKYTKSNIAVQTHTGTWKAESMLFATGHCYANDPLIADRHIPFAFYRQSAYPVSQFDTVPAEQHVGIVGLGLTFIDIALALTEGRGGVFNNGVYQPSGTEPLLFPFSRTSLPILCRGPQYQPQRPLYVITEDWFNKLKERGEKIDFLTEILPLIEEEVQMAYYSVLLDVIDPRAIREKISQILPQERFSLEDLLHPVMDSEERILQYIRTAIDEAYKGEEKSPLMAAAAVWGKVSPWIAELYTAGGFTGKSQTALDRHYFGAFNRVSYGPPIANMEKIYALAKAGIIRFSALQNPKITWHHTRQKFSVSDTTGQEIQLGVLIDARIGRPALQKKNAPLYENLLQQGLITSYDNQGYRPGTLALDKRGKCTTIDNLPFYCYGSNTEGIFFDNDTLSRTKNDTARYWVQETLNKNL